MERSQGFDGSSEANWIRTAAASLTMADPIADRFEQAESRLQEWGIACRHNSEVFGLPTISTMAATVAHIQAQERLRRGVRKRKLRKKHAQWKEGDPPLDPKEVAVVKGFAEVDLTASGKQTRSGEKKIALALDSKTMEVDRIVTGLPKWAQKCIRRRYLFGQPDRIAADEMKMRVEEYAGRRRCAVEKVAERLAQRYSAPVSTRKTARAG